ncbi:hypothetical protein JK358_32840 [Nocardia sp. 2]|uniref:DUF7919 domain-containing protein n=1 Tax=Nocardia acididurans TaxID=2802282 RepID=A0ABS1MEZ6_9NOCA|nr:hypothetical protein [Nocardia acididurans]MBL1079203.1 hypothetical protein [Nocardia acididurans]
MTYFADLSPYVYLSDTVAPGEKVLNVGWLENGQPFDTGTTSTGFVEKLGELCRTNPVARTRGVHACDLCAEDEKQYPVTPLIDGVPVPLGGAEVRVPAISGEILAAPDLVYHYVVKHGYLPPTPFIEAVLAC